MKNIKTILLIIPIAFIIWYLYDRYGKKTTDKKLLMQSDALKSSMDSELKRFLDSKVDIIAGKKLSTEDFSTEEKLKLEALTIGETGTGSTIDAASLRDRTTHTGVQAISTVTGLQAALDSKLNNHESFNTQTASYTLVLADDGKIIDVNSTTPTTITVPTNATVAYPIGTVITIAQYNTGQVTIAGASGVTIAVSGGRSKLSQQYAVCTIIKRATNEWYLSGDLTN